MKSKEDLKNKTKNKQRLLVRPKNDPEKSFARILKGRDLYLNKNGEISDLMRNFMQ
jgi:hypothetical protein